MIKGFERGCDDYIVKPFSMDVLKLKINAILKRSVEIEKDIFRYNNLKIDFESKKVFVKNEEVNLAVTEYKLLELLSKNKGRAVTKELILGKPWDSNGNYVDENAITQLYKKAEMKNININFHSEKDILLIHDKNWTMEAIFNIIENVIKHSPRESEINISVESYEMFTKIDIKDEGTGIKEEEMPRIFSRFYRGENTYEEEGIGIGLYLSREIITKEDGYIKVSSNSNGSIFSVHLPNKI